jgi:catechol 2,3-dioxygenase-like lactoylglutathione lyase family enzyme
MIIKESNVTINVKKLNDSISFYESIGFTVKNRWGEHYAQMTAPGITIGLHPTDEANLKGNSGNVSIGFTTDNFEATEALLKEQNISVVERKEDGGQFLHFNDSDGTSLYFIKPNW